MKGFKQTKEIKELQESLNFLTSHYDKYISDSKVKAHIAKLEKYRNSPELLRAIKEKHRPTEINVNTVGAYLWGCSQNYYGNVNKNCSPLCFGSIPHEGNSLLSEDSLNCEKCQYSIWTYSKEKLHNDFATSSSKAYIYVDDNWKGFKNSDIEMLKKSGVFYASIFNTVYSQHKSLLPMTPIDNLPTFKEYSPAITRTITKDSFYWIFIIFAILILLIIIYFKHTFANSN
jgi:hypothetical protein